MISIITGARVTSDIKDGRMTLAVDQNILTDGKYEKKTLWVTAFVKGDIATRAEKLKIKKGSILNVEGNFNLSGRMGKENVPYINTSIFVTNLSYALGSCVDGLEIKIQDATLTKDIEIKEDKKFAFTQLYYKTTEKDESGTWKSVLKNVNLMIPTATAERLVKMGMKKDSIVHVTGRPIITPNVSGDKVYANMSLMVDNIGYGGKPSEKKKDKAVEETTSTEPTEPTTSEIPDDIDIGDLGGDFF